MGDRKQPRPVPTNQVRPAPPPAPPRKVDQVVEHVISDGAVRGAMRAFGIESQHPVDRHRRRIDLLTGLFYVLSRDYDVAGDDLERVIRDHVSKMVGQVPGFIDKDRESWSRALAIELNDMLQRHAASNV
jgi:hypothetical protein